MKAVEQQKAAKQFAEDWLGRGDEKQDTQAFWLSLLQKVYGVPDSFWYLMLTVGAGEVIACGILGLLLYKALSKTKIF